MKKELKNTVITLCGILIASTLFFNGMIESHPIELEKKLLTPTSQREATESVFNPDISRISYKIFVRNLPYLNNK